jgi:hypothetical protein
VNETDNSSEDTLIDEGIYDCQLTCYKEEELPIIFVFNMQINLLSNEGQVPFDIE